MKSYRQVRQMIHRGWPGKRSDCPTITHAYWHCYQDLTEVDGLILKGDRIVIPKSMRNDLLRRIHEGHMGIEKCKRRARQSIYWPHINNQIEQLVGHCEECRKLLPSKPVEPLLHYPLPERPWQQVGYDLFHFAINTYVVIVDYYSLWPEIYKLT